MLIGFNQNGAVIKVIGFVVLLSRIEKLPADKESLTYSVQHTERGNPVKLPRSWGDKSQGLFIALRVKEVSKSESFIVTMEILVET